MTALPKSRYVTPSARTEVMDPGLVRPNWVNGDSRDADLLWLDKNENLDPALMALTSRVLAEVPPIALCTYPELAHLYLKLGSFLSVRAESLLLTAGSDGAIRSVFEAYVRPGDIVLHTAPTFAMYSVYGRMYGARTVTLDYQPSAHGPVLKAEVVIDAIRRADARLVCLPNPDSPTGTVFEPDALRAIIEAAGEAGALVLIDEAYHPFYEETALPWIETYPHLVIARTFAKAWGLAGLRIGYAAACPDVIGLLHKVRSMYEVNTVGAAVVERMLDYSQEVHACVRRVNEGRDRFLDAMEELKLRTVRARGNFMHVAFGADAPAVHAALKGLVLYRRDFSEPCLKGFSRFSAAISETLQPVIERIGQTLHGRG